MKLLDTIISIIKEAKLASKNKDELIELDLAILKLEHEEKVIEILNEIPYSVKDIVLEHTKLDPYGNLTIHNLNSSEDLVNLNWDIDKPYGTANPKPNSFVSYLFKRLKDEGLKPKCYWIYKYPWLSWIWKEKICWISLYYKDLNTPEIQPKIEQKIEIIIPKPKPITNINNPYLSGMFFTSWDHRKYGDGFVQKAKETE